MYFYFIEISSHLLLTALVFGKYYEEARVCSHILPKSMPIHTVAYRRHRAV